MTHYSDRIIPVPDSTSEVVYRGRFHPPSGASVGTGPTSPRLQGGKWFIMNSSSFSHEGDVRIFTGDSSPQTAPLLAGSIAAPNLTGSPPTSWRRQARGGLGRISGGGWGFVTMDRKASPLREELNFWKTSDPTARSGWSNVGNIETRAGTSALVFGECSELISAPGVLYLHCIGSQVPGGIGNYLDSNKSYALGYASTDGGVTWDAVWDSRQLFSNPIRQCNAVSEGVVYRDGRWWTSIHSYGTITYERRDSEVVVISSPDLINWSNEGDWGLNGSHKTLEFCNSDGRGTVVGYVGHPSPSSSDPTLVDYTRMMWWSTQLNGFSMQTASNGASLHVSGGGTYGLTQATRMSRGNNLIITPVMQGDKLWIASSVGADSQGMIGYYETTGYYPPPLPDSNSRLLGLRVRAGVAYA